MHLLVTPDTLKSHKLRNREEIGVDKNVHDGPVAFTALLRILREIDCQGDTVHMAEAPQVFEPTMFGKETQSVVVPCENISTEANVYEESLITLA